MERPTTVATGVPQLDTILGGGIVERSLLLVAGPPGSGKTLLASQIMASAVDRGDAVLLVTAFSEPHAKLIAHLRGFSFFRPEALGARIKLLNLQNALLTGIEEASDTLVREAREHDARLILLDGLDGIVLNSSNLLASYRFLYDTSAKLEVLGITMLITYGLAPGAELDSPELTAVDTIVALSYDAAGHARRSLRVVKHRGAAHLPGYHHFVIDEQGVHCFVRLESLPHPEAGAVEVTRAAFGIAQLDAAMGGGPNRATSTLLRGPAAVCRSLALRWLSSGLQANERARLLSLRETEPHLRAAAGSAQLEHAVSSGRLQLRSYRAHELLPDRLAHELLSGLEDNRPWRIVIDGAGELAASLAADSRQRVFWQALLAQLQARGATTLLLDDRKRSDAPELAGVTDNRLRARKNDDGIRVKVGSMRYSAFDPRPVVMDRETGRPGEGR